MVELLVSVRDAAEAEEALAAGAHWIDVKEPTRGALGRADAATVASVLAAVAGRCPVSVALGELLDGSAAAARDLPSGVGFVKLGLSRCADRGDWTSRWEAALGERPAGAATVAVAYADHRTAGAPEPLDVLRFSRRGGCRALLLDTFRKDRGGVFDHLPARHVAEILRQARDGGLLTVLGGSLAEDSWASAMQVGADLLAVRGAVCRGGRQGPLDGARVRDFIHRLGHASPAKDRFA